MEEERGGNMSAVSIIDSREPISYSTKTVKYYNDIAGTVQANLVDPTFLSVC